MCRGEAISAWSRPLGVCAKSKRSLHAADAQLTRLMAPMWRCWRDASARRTAWPEDRRASHTNHHTRHTRNFDAVLWNFAMRVRQGGVGYCQQIRGTTTVGLCTVPNCVLYLATFCYISLEKTRLPVLSDPRLVCVPADNTPDGF